MAVVCSPLPHVAFTMLRNCWLRDARISYKAKGLLGYLRSHAEGYRVSQAQIIRESADGRAAVVSGLEELQAAGYLERVPHRGPGRFAEDDYALMDPFDALGRLTTLTPRETRTSTAPDMRGTLHSGFSAVEIPQREIDSIEEQGEETRELQLLSLDLPAKERRPAVPDLFDEFWAAYPRKVGKGDARKVWQRAARSTDPDKIIAAVRVYPFDLTRVQFIPYPSTWLSGAHWEDDPAALVPSPSSNGHRPFRNPPPGTHAAQADRPF